MLFILNKLFDVGSKRVNTYREVMEAFASLPGGKVSTLMDMEAAFYNVAREREAGDRYASRPRGLIGSNLKAHTHQINRTFHQAVNEGQIPTLAELPVNVLHPQSKAQLDHKYPKDDAFDSFRPSHLECAYLSDYIACVEKFLNVRQITTVSTIYGQTQDIKDVFDALNSVPDYSSHFPRRPPNNGNSSKNKRETASMPLFPGLAVPGRA